MNIQKKIFKIILTYFLLFNSITINLNGQETALSSNGGKILLNFLPLVGGTISGTIMIKGNTTINGTLKVGTLIYPKENGLINQLLASDGTENINWLTLNASSIGLGYVNNTSDLDKPVSTATSEYVFANADRYNSITSGTEISTNSTIDVIANNLALTVVTAGKYLVDFNGQYTIEPLNRTAQATTDLTAAYNYLMAMPITNSTHGVAYGAGEILTPGVYHNTGAVTTTGAITLDAGGNPNAQFIFQFGAAFSTGAGFNVILVNGASACNVFWIAEGAIALGASTIMKGFLISNSGAVSLGSMSNVQGNLFSSGGAIGLDASTLSRVVGCNNNFGSINNFAIYSKSGSISNVGTSNITGDIATNSGTVSGFESATISASILASGISNATANFSIYQNGVQIPFSSRKRISSTNLGEISLQAIATVGAGENIDIRWNIDLGIVKLQNRILTLLNIR